MSTRSYTRRDFLRASSLALAGAGGGVGALGWQTGRREPAVATHELTLAGLHPSLDGFRLLLVSDVHAGANMDGARMSGIVEVANSLQPDVVILGGDQLDATATEEDAHAFGEAFRALSAPHGTLFVPGNHDHYAGIGLAVEACGYAGLQSLADSPHVVERDGGKLAFLGVDDPQVETFDPPQTETVRRAVQHAPEGPLPILVAHRPAAFDEAARLGVPLTLSGHTHGGQVGLPWGALSPVRFLTRYLRGHYARGDSHLVVSAGVGTGGFPFRVGIPPSVSLVELKAAEGRRESRWA